MSGTIISVIISSASGLIGVLLGSWITLRKLRYERSDKYLLASLDKKIKAHQEAYDLSWDLPSVAHESENDSEYLRKCEEWYRKNCLYLEPEAREAFFKAYRTAVFYYLYKHDWKTSGDDKDLKERWQDIINAKYIIEKNVTKPLIEPPILKKDSYDFKGKIEKK